MNKNKHAGKKGKSCGQYYGNWNPDCKSISEHNAASYSACNMYIKADYEVLFLW